MSRAAVAAPPEVLDRLGDALTAFRRVLQLPQVSTYMRQRLEGVDLSHFRTLFAIEAAKTGGGTPSVGDIAAALDVEVSTASRQLDQAIAAGLVDRRRADSDGRRRELSLTAAGRRCLAQMHEARRALLREVTEGLDPADIEAAARVLVHMHERARLLSSEPVSG